ncbi:hypothetical protein DMENIID0001_156950 [Sergentomyia squamirostris]
MTVSLCQEEVPAVVLSSETKAVNSMRENLPLNVRSLCCIFDTVSARKCFLPKDCSLNIISNQSCPHQFPEIHSRRHLDVCDFRKDSELFREL